MIIHYLAERHHQAEADECQAVVLQIAPYFREAALKRDDTTAYIRFNALIYTHTLQWRGFILPLSRPCTESLN